MVWKRLIIIVAVLAILSSMTINASAADVYTEGNISTTYVTYFQDILGKVSPLKDYVFFRSGQYEYTMVVGDLELSSGVFISSQPCEVYTIYSTTSSGYNQTYSFGSTIENTYSLRVADSLVYSNLGDYPDLIERGDYLETAVLLLILVALCMSLVARIFNFCLRIRR